MGGFVEQSAGLFYELEQADWLRLSTLRAALDGWLRRLQAVDRKLLTAMPALGRYCWETVLMFER